MSFDADTSTDELAASLGVRYPSPARARLLRDVGRPLATRSPNIKRKQLNLDVTPSLLRGVSPAKSMFFDPEEGADSPWRIKVTVQAEPRLSSPTAQRYSSPAKSPAPRTRVTRVPLKDADGDSSPAKPTRRKRKSDSGEAIKNRKGTPMRRKSGRQSAGSRAQDGPDDVAPVAPVAPKIPATRKRGRARKSAGTEESEILDSIIVTNPGAGEVGPDNAAQAEAREQENEAEDHDDDQMRDGSNDAAGQTHVEQDVDVDFVHVDAFDHDAGSNDEQYLPPERETFAAAITPVPIQVGSPMARGFEQSTSFNTSNSTRPQKQNTPPQRSRGSGSKMTRIYRDQPQRPFANMFSSLPPRQPLIKSPSPFSRRQSSPATEEDADMWRGMLGHVQQRVSSNSVHSDDNANADDESADSQSAIGDENRVRGHGRSQERSGSGSEQQDPTDDEPSSEVDEPGYEDDIPEPTGRTIGEATMMQSEDFSIVSLSSLPSSKVNSSVLGQSEVDKSLLGPSRLHPRRPSGLAKTVTFSSPLAQSFHSNREQSFHEESDDAYSDSAAEDEFEAASHPLPQKQSQQHSSPHLPRESHTASQYKLNTPQHSHNHITSSSGDQRVALKQDILRQSQTPDPSRLPTPSSGGESQISPPQLPIDDLPPSDISYPDVDDTEYPVVDSTPAGRSEAEMSTPPATPERDDAPHVQRKREASLMSSGGNSTRRSWVDEPKSARMIALEKRWQQERENVARTIALAKGQAMVVDEEDDEDKEADGGDDESQDRPTEEQTEDIWQDISASYDDADSRGKRKVLVTHARPTTNTRPAKFARTEQREDTGMPLQQGQTTPSNASNLGKNMASVKRKGKVQADVSALFGRLAGNSSRQSSHAPAAPSPLRQTDDGAFDETDLSDVRQIRNEMKAAKRPPFPHVTRGTTTTIPTKLKSIDDTMTTQDEEDFDEQMSDEPHNVDQSVMSFTGHQPATRSLFNNTWAQQVQTSTSSAFGLKHVPTQAPAEKAMEAPPAVPVPSGMFATIWDTLTFSKPYASPPRPTHPILNSNAFPLLPRVWPWSHTHWQTLDSLYQYYKRKPSRFSPSRTSHPDNRGLMTPFWSRYVDITMDHWGYRVRLESTHIVLAILYTHLLLLPSEREYEKVYSKPLEWGKQDRTERVGKKITEWDVVIHLFAVISGEMLREDEREGRRVRRDEVVFRYRLKGEKEWRVVEEGKGPVF